jgi:hypothetical protein
VVYYYLVGLYLGNGVYVKNIRVYINQLFSLPVEII